MAAELAHAEADAKAAALAMSKRITKRGGTGLVAPAGSGSLGVPSAALPERVRRLKLKLDVLREEIERTEEELASAHPEGAEVVASARARASARAMEGAHEADDAHRHTSYGARNAGRSGGGSGIVAVRRLGTISVKHGAAAAASAARSARQRRLQEIEDHARQQALAAIKTTLDRRSPVQTRPAQQALPTPPPPPPVCPVTPPVTPPVHAQCSPRLLL